MRWETGDWMSLEMMEDKAYKTLEPRFLQGDTNLDAVY